jgi:hypothetical protein
MAAGDNEALCELVAASRHRRQVDREMTMSERLAALHQLCMQLTAIDAPAKRT